MILAGGKSIRMGQDKAFIEVDGIPIILRIFAVLDRLFPETIIVANEEEPYGKLGIPVYSDLIPGQGALGGLYTGLVYSTFSYSFCVACDMPFLDRAFDSISANQNRAVRCCGSSHERWLAATACDILEEMRRADSTPS